MLKKKIKINAGIKSDPPLHKHHKKTSLSYDLLTNIIIAPANTGIDRSNKTTVIFTAAYLKRGIRSANTPNEHISNGENKIYNS